MRISPDCKISLTSCAAVEAACRQAEVARRAQVIQTDVRDSRLRLLADDLVNLQGELRS